MKTTLIALSIWFTCGIVLAQEWVCANGRCTLVRQTPRVTVIKIERDTFVPQPVRVQVSTNSFVPVQKTVCNCATTGVCVCEPSTCACKACKRGRR